MVIVGLTDIHGRIEDIDRLNNVLQAADLVILAGDITNFGRDTAAEKVIAAVRRYAPAVLAVHGNCDHAEVEQVLVREKVNCHGDCVSYGGVNFIGLGGSLTTPFNTPGEYTEEELNGFLEAAAAKMDKKVPLAFISHQPPVDTICDRLGSGSHVGSQAVRRFIEKHKPFFCLTGHIHEAVGVDTIGQTAIINPGLAGKGGYMYAEILSREEVVALRNVNQKTV